LAEFYDSMMNGIVIYPLSRQGGYLNFKVCLGKMNYSDTSANEDNLFWNHIR